MKKKEEPVKRELVKITLDKVSLEGNLVLPKDAQGIVLFAHGSGSSRFSPRNQYVAGVLRRNRLATMLIDLLTPEEEAVDRQTGHLRFDIPLLTDRLIGATGWLKKNHKTKNLPLGYFGSSTGAAAALIAAARYPGDVQAVVSRGGRPDLANPYLQKVKAPTLLIVGGNDFPVIEINKEALKKLLVEHKLEIIPRATHLFEEPGALEEVARLAAAWFARHLKRRKKLSGN